MHRAILLGLALSLLPASGWAAQDDVIGSIKNHQGDVAVVRAQQRLPAQVGMKLAKSDVLRTGADSSLGVILRDDSLLSLGPNSEVALVDFAFAPAEGTLAMVTRMVKGTAAFLSGQIARLAPQSVRFETPVATIGIRGTKFAVKIEESRP